MKPDNTCVNPSCPNPRYNGTTHCKQHLLKLREYFKRRSIKSKKLGLCHSCRKRRVVKGYTLCAVCNKRMAQNRVKRYNIRKANEICIWCGKPLDDYTRIIGTVTCGSCLDANVRYQHRKQYENKTGSAKV